MYAFHRQHKLVCYVKQLSLQEKFGKVNVIGIITVQSESLFIIIMSS